MSKGAYRIYRNIFFVNKTYANKFYEAAKTETDALNEELPEYRQIRIGIDDKGLSCVWFQNITTETWADLTNRIRIHHKVLYSKKLNLRYNDIIVR